jgi:hypothetical protein
MGQAWKGVSSRSISVDTTARTVTLPSSARHVTIVNTGTVPVHYKLGGAPTVTAWPPTTTQGALGDPAIAGGLAGIIVDPAGGSGGTLYLITATGSAACLLVFGSEVGN